MSDLAIIGSFPPPNGGVATHVQRLLPLLRARNISFRVYNAVSESAMPPDVVTVATWRRRWLLQFLLTCEEKAILIMSDRIGVLCLSVILGRLRGKKVAVRLRNSALLDNIGSGGWRAWLSKKVICRMDLVVCVNRELLCLVLELGAPDDSVILAPGFLPPTDRCQDPNLVNRAVWEFLEGKQPVLAANGKIGWYQGVDLYGLDLLIDLAAYLRHDYPKIALIVCFWDHAPEDDERLRDLNKKAAELGLAHSVFLNTASGVFVPVLAKSNVFVRPTATDGDANSIREALAMRIPVVASDVVDRPDGCLVHRNRDLDSLVEKTRIALGSQSADRPSTSMMLTGQSRECIDTYIDCLEKIAE